MKLQRDVFGHAKLAHISLKDTGLAETYTEGTLTRVTKPVTDLHLSQTPTRLDRQILYGHPVRQLEKSDGLSRDETSGYVGYVAPGSLAPWAAPTHRVCTATTLLFSDPDIKAPNPVPLSHGALLSIISAQGRFSQTIDGLFAITAHLEPAHQHEPDLAKTATLFLGTPYLWGGNSAFGIDCSGLVQQACQCANIPCPGDSDQQMDTLGQTLPARTGFLRNDLLFWPGHVAIVYDTDTLIHANAHHMATALEPITEALERIDASGNGPLLAHKRL